MQINVAPRWVFIRMADCFHLCYLLSEDYRQLFDIIIINMTIMNPNLDHVHKNINLKG